MKPTTNAIKYEVIYIGFPLAYLHLTMANSTGQGQGHVFFNCEYLVDDDRVDNSIPSNRKLHVGFRLAYFNLTLAHSEEQCRDHAHF